MRYCCLLHYVIAGTLLYTSISATVLAQPSSPVPGRANPAPKADTLAPLATIPGMKVEIDFRAKWVRLDELIGAIRQNTGVALEVDPDIAGRRLNLFTYKATAIRDVTIIAREMGLICRVSPVIPGRQPTYTLALSEERRQKEEWWKSASERREKGRYAAFQRRMEETLEQERQRNESGVGALLGTLSPEEIRRIAEVSQEGPPVISASNQSHFHNFMMFARPYKGLPDGVQKSLQDMLGRPEYAEQNLKIGASSLAELEQCQVGIIAANGFVMIGLYNPAEGAVWVSPLERTGTPTPSDEEALNDFNPQVIEMLDSPKLVSGLPKPLGEKRIRFPKEVDRRHLANLLEVVAQKFQLSFVTQDYLRTRVVDPLIARNLVPAAQEFKLRDALWQIARAFGHQVVFENNVLYVTTLTPGADLRAEPPAEILDYLKRLEQKKEPVSFESYLKLTAISWLQLKTLIKNITSNLVGVRAMLYNLLQVHSVLHPYGQLSPEQQQQAEREGGVYIPDLERRTEQAFRALAGRGLPSAANGDGPEGVQYKPKHFYVRREATKDNKAEVFTFTVTSDRIPIQCTKYRFLIPKPMLETNAE